MHDTTLQVLDIRALPVTEGEESVTLAMLTGIPTPFAGPDGQPVTLVSAVYKVPMGKQAAIDLIESLQEEVAKLPEPKRASNIVIPGSPSDVDRVAQNINQFKTGDR